MPICDNCQTAAYDLDPHFFTQLTHEDAVATMNTVVLEMGSDLPDHVCDTVEDPEYPDPCDCPCHPQHQPVTI